MSPLAGVKILEFGGIGPGPFAGMVLADMGAHVIRLHRHGETFPVSLPGAEAERRGRPGLAVDLKDPDDIERVYALVDAADVLIEGFRPGVMERLGLGPRELLARNPRLVYGRITGYGQDGPLAHAAGHDINYLAISGVLSALGREGERPQAPINLLGDYGGGGMLLALGVLGALVQTQRDGRGQVVDAAMIDGVAQLATLVFGAAAASAWGPPGSNVIDSGAHFYEVYETADGRHFAVGAIEPQFYSELIRCLGMDIDAAPQWDRSRWRQLKTRFAEVFRSKTRDEWATIFDGVEACATPVLELHEAANHPHHQARNSFVVREGALLPARAPRFSLAAPEEPPTPQTSESLRLWGFGDAEIATLTGSGT